MKIFIRIIRVILGIALLIGFAYGLYTCAQAAPHTGDYLYNLEETPAAPAPVVSQSGKTGSSAASAVTTDNGTSAPTDVQAAPVVEPVPEPTPLPDTPEGRAAALGLSAPPQVDITSWEYMLVNGDNSIDEYAPETLAYLNPTIDETDIRTTYSQYRQNSVVDIRIAQALLDMCVAAENDGQVVYIASGYRSYASQQENFIRVCNNNGVSDGKDANGFYITMPPGCSEHQSGLCVDITDKWSGIKTAAELRNNPLSVWLAEHCAEYGFILRFPEGKESVTGVMYEPWHFRYVGVDAAKYITENGITLEEFVGLYA